jgi:hypothetical protein
MRGFWEGAFAVAAFAGSEAYASNRPVLRERPEPNATHDSRHHHDQAAEANGVIRPVLPAIRLTIR